MALVQTQYYAGDAPAYATGTRTGIRTPSNFTVQLGFAPKCIHVINLTTRVEAIHFVNSELDNGNNSKSLCRHPIEGATYEDSGITATNNSFSVNVSTISLETTNCDLVWSVFA